MLNSRYADLGPVALPEWRGRQKYMHTFDASAPVMAEGFEDYGPVVTALVKSAEVVGEAHMTVDEKIVQPGMSQRRPGAHLDGRFLPEQGSWGHPGPGHWAHYCNRVPMDRMAVIVAASVAGCRIYEGDFDAQPASDGDLEHIRDELGSGILLDANRGYLLSPDCVHESVIFNEPTKRTFLRIAFDDPRPRVAV